MSSSASAAESIPLSKAERGAAGRRWEGHVWAGEGQAPPVSRIVNDLLMVGLAFRVAYWIRFETGLSIFAEVLSSRAYYERVGLILTPVWLLIFAVGGLDP